MTAMPSQFRRVHPSPGLMIDVDVWRDAHEYHRDQMHLHHLALHGWGIVQGLDVHLVQGAENTLRIDPGLAIDPAGNFVVVSEGQSYHITTPDPGTVYLILQFREVLAGPASASRSSRAAPLSRVIEAYHIQERDQLPDEPYLELARVNFQPSAGPLRAAHNAEQPGVNELDLRSRVRLGTVAAPLVLTPAPPTPEPMSPDLAPVTNGTSGSQDRPLLAPRIDGLAERLEVLAQRVEALATPRAVAPAVAPSDALTPRVDQLDNQVTTIANEVRDLSQRMIEQPRTPTVAAPAPDRKLLEVGIASHSGAGWDAHADGLRLLVREIGLTTNFHVRALEPTSAASAGDQDVLYVSGTAALALSDAEIEGLARVLERGGVVVGEGCAAGPSGEAGVRAFAVSFVALAERLGRQLVKVERGHPLLSARHVFGEPPTGGRASALVMESSGLVLCDADYGCAWRGGPGNRVLARTAIRDATEFGVNLALFRSTAADAANRQSD